MPTSGYGEYSYGETFYAGVPRPESYAQGHEPAAKQGTRYLGKFKTAFADLAEDLSQFLTDMTAGASWIHESGSTRMQIGHPRTIGVLLDHDEGSDTGYLFNHGSAGDESISFSASDTILIRQNNANRLSRAIPFLNSAGSTVHRLLVAWVSIANPDTTGPSDAVLSWLLVANDAGDVYRERFTHVVKTSPGTINVFGASSTAGGSTYSGSLLRCWYANNQQSLTEMALDHGLAILANLTTATQADSRAPLPVTESSGVGDEGEFYGVQPAWVARQTATMVRRLWSPLWNERMRNVETWQQADWANHPLCADAPQTSDAHTLMLGWYTPAPVPPGASHAWVRVHLFSEPVSGGSVPLGVRLYSCNKPPVLGVGQIILQGNDAPESFDARYVEAVVDRDDGGTVGSYVVLGLLPLAVGQTGIRKGMTYLALAIAVDPDNASANDANASWQIAAVHVVPTNAEVEGGLPQGQIGLGGD